MTLIEFVRLVLKHIRVLVLVPLLLGIMVLLLTMNPSFEYTSQTILYTGLATGSSIEMDKKFNYQATNTAFDNLINIINSRETQEEVAIRLLALHLMLPEANPKYISESLFDEFQNKIPEDLYDYVANDSTEADTSSEVTEYDNELFPKEINRSNYEKTVQNLTSLMKSSNNNFVYELLNYGEDEHYSLKAISNIKAQRINSSDLIKLSYTVNDPGICQQTLAIYSRVCIINYKYIKENRSDAVVRYFENELANARAKLKDAEDELLQFNKSSNIINYYEQSKAVAIVKEDMEVDFKKNTAELAGIQAGTKKIEEKLKIQEIVQAKNNEILQKKKELGDLNFKIGLTQAKLQSNNDETVLKQLSELKEKAENLTKEIKKGVDDLYSYQNSIEGVPITQVLPEWMDNVVEVENLKAKIDVIKKQKNNFQEVYAEYAPAGANMKRLEREISVSEQGYLEILHGLNLAKLKLQDSELASSLKTIDTPYYPLSPNPTKRAILIIAAVFIGGIFTLGSIFVMEYFDETLRNSSVASKKIGLASLGMIPKIVMNPGRVDFHFIQSRLIEMITQNIVQYFDVNQNKHETKTIIVLSTQKTEGKSVLSGNIAKALKQEGKKVLLMNYEGGQKSELNKQKSSILNSILGYPDERIDVENSFLAHPTDYLNASEYCSYQIDKHFYSASTYKDILKHNNISLDIKPDYAIIEVPGLIYSKYPSDLIANADLDILVCRSNRIWSDADESAIKNLKETSGSKFKIIVNGVAINETESILGDLPKKRSNFRKKMKSIFKFQFLSRQQI